MSGLIFKKMSEVMRDIGAIGKEQKNAQQGFKFRGIDDMLNSLYPALTRHGVFMTTEIIQESHEIREVVRSNGKTGADKHVSVYMKYTFHAEDGSSVSSSVPAEGLDSGDKATNKALSAALKYALIQTFCIPTEDIEEADRTSPELGTTSKITSEPVTSTTSTETVVSEPVTATQSTREKPTFRKAKPAPTPATDSDIFG